MINLIEIASTIEAILNGTYPELNPDDLLERPNFQFLVKAGGVHLDSIANKANGTNVIPVFVETLGGSIKAVQNLQEANYTIPVTIYFPLRYREEFLKMPQYIADVFVAKIIKFGEDNQGLCNISPAQYGEIENVDMNAFSNWVKRCYNQVIGVTEIFMTLSFQLFISSAKNLGKENGPIYGNSLKLSVSFSIDGETYEDNDPIFLRTAVSEQTNESSEQILGNPYIESLPIGSAYTTPLNLYVKKSLFYKKLISTLIARKASLLEISLKMELPELLDEPNIETYYASNTGIDFTKGELITVALNLGDKKQL